MARLFDFDPFLGDLPNDVVAPVDRADFATIVPATPAQLAKLLLSMPVPEGGFPAGSLGEQLTGGLPAGWAGPGSVATPMAGGPVAAATPFTPFQVVWLLELVCSIAGAATVMLAGTRRDDAISETVATYNLAAGQTVCEANDRTDYVSFVWTSTGSGVVNARII